MRRVHAYVDGVRLLAGVDTSDPEWSDKLCDMSDALNLIKKRLPPERVAFIVVGDALFVGLDVNYLDNGKHADFLDYT